MCQELLGYAFCYTHYFKYSFEQPSEGGGGPIRNCFMDEGNVAQRGEVTCGNSPGYCTERIQGWNPEEGRTLGHFLVSNIAMYAGMQSAGCPCLMSLSNCQNIPCLSFCICSVGTVMPISGPCYKAYATCYI